MANKLKIGWFSFTCCEDSTIIFTELLNTHWKNWKNQIEFVHVKVLKKSPEIIPEMDIAFVEGAIAGDRQEQKLKDIRQKAKKLVAIGSCAVVGSPSNQRNFFNRSQLDEIRPILERFKYKEKVLKLSDIVKVDDVVNGCPMNEAVFLQIMDKLLNT
ncbi:hypothetical protein A3A46_02535 [Candidatus Roizmanbacteria bacterium RIFCSPLOWO2_01_FULL_37_13]|uniref:NADH:ubiquinone oxidoreductase-like 20kDa subunit domain-containing protein n=1 Tax=Candidatus Roizmanbacteria bacterium RIFCSPHIGHO2_02_FULL_38_11 TaxID=1802039 RepID=A0A1F7H3D8_9BACT|nr:MAG: hypothetical protein A3C25_04100 [Candidatus Roizmanbacteria bacterium RIFCSPHIGHO2_02_FULL_38_11]OGK33434.1 MAG: hypothetical protein A3F58_02075 [Candidatus Roizmanbacteria bacterium RIFCSPHIGHO2_12_FULL_37_9b]OGK41450.1 MAG: hypothetical protein A3A46_02535 [Candidatus Roizmanbacteria bacterium RIFCSPLOWO2_01_FULL_37_13]